MLPAHPGVRRRSREGAGLNEALQKVADKPYIGGFFELEQPAGGGRLHTEALGLATGRACLAVIMEELRPRRVHVPFYACEALYQPLRDRCELRYFGIDEHLEIAGEPGLEADDLLVYIDYFGIKAGYVDRLAKRLGPRLVIDDTHNFFRGLHPGHWSFCSARKYFGVPDGAYLYAPQPLSPDLPRNEAIRMEHLVNRREGRQALAFVQFQAYEQTLDAQPKRLSETSERILDRIDYSAVRRQRRENYAFLHERLGDLNTLRVPGGPVDAFCYPLLPRRPIRKRPLHEEGVFVPTLWPDVLERAGTGFDLERRLARDLLPLPIDHRYVPDDLERVCTLVHELAQTGAAR